MGTAASDYLHHALPTGLFSKLDLLSFPRAHRHSRFLFPQGKPDPCSALFLRS